MTSRELAFYAATFGDNGSFDKITEIGWNSEEQFLTETAKRLHANWSHCDDGRKVMTIRKSNGTAGLDCKLIVKDGWLATLDYAQMEASLDESANKKVKTVPIYEDDYEVHYDDDVATEDYGLEDYNDDYGWWR
jgi:hypothetical protein